MEKNNIIQFVCFVTNLDQEDFTIKWAHYAKQFMADTAEITLQMASGPGKRSKYKYVSQHECAADNFRFDFMKNRNSEYFPEHTVKVVQAGGYTAIQIQCISDEDMDDVKVIVFIDYSDTDLDFYQGQIDYRYLNIYEAYFESCLYSYVLEFFVQEQQAAALLELLKTRTGTEAAVYKECPVLHDVR